MARGALPKLPQVKYVYMMESTCTLLEAIQIVDVWTLLKDMIQRKKLGIPYHFQLWKNEWVLVVLL